MTRQPTIAALFLLLLAGCSRPLPQTPRFSILAGSELKDIESDLKPEILKATGLNVAFDYSGTLDAIDRISSGEKFDALWVSHGKYLAMNPALQGKILAQEKIMLSPVLLGLKASRAHQLGWDTTEPTWRDISSAARDGKFTFGMTNPTSSNSGLTAIIGLASALAKNPEALTNADLTSASLSDFFRAQKLTSGSSGWLADAYRRDPSKVDGIVNYESVLLSLNASGQLPEPLTLVYPKEGIVTADYPLMLLEGSRRADYEKLVAYLRQKEIQTRISSATLRRPVNPDATLAPAIPRRTLIELPFPGQAAQIDTLLQNFLSTLRIPGSSRYVLDLSGSMSGSRIDSLKKAMLMLASDATPRQSFARFQNREEVGIVTFSSQTAPTELFQMGSDPDENAKARAAIAHFIEPLNAGGGTAIFSSVQQALLELNQEREKDPAQRYYTVVLMTDGENNRGMNLVEFEQWYRTRPETLRAIRVFPILFGEGSAKELQALADLTGGRLFDSRSKPLPAVFKEIRAYQ